MSTEPIDHKELLKGEKAWGELQIVEGYIKRKMMLDLDAPTKDDVDSVFGDGTHERAMKIMADWVAARNG